MTLNLTHRMRSAPAGTAVVATAMLLILMPRPARADGTPFFSSDQVSSGRWEYSQHCSVCHGATLSGGGAPGLKGATFVAQWNGKQLKEFYGYVHDQMPLGQAGTLDGQQYADIVSFVLAQNGLPGGTDPLTPSTPMDRALDLAGAIGNAAAAAGPAEPVVIGKLYG